MKWKKISIKTITDAEDIIISTLYDIGLEGAQIEDKVPLTESEKEQMFVDILPVMEPDDSIAILNFFVEEEREDEFEDLINNVKTELAELSSYMDIGEGTVTVSETEDKDWINNWKEFFHQFTIDDLLIIPSWEDIEEKDKDKKMLRIDPGTAFGTGAHETTQLCIRQIAKYVTSETVLLDVGCGSGILGIVALLYGAKSCKGTDLDPQAIFATNENLERNHLSQEQFEVQIGNIISDPKVSDALGYDCYDIVVANILAGVLVPLTPVIVHQMKEGGIYITSGILDEKEEEVKAAILAAGLKILETTYQGEWVSITAQK